MYLLILRTKNLSVESWLFPYLYQGWIQRQILGVVQIGYRDEIKLLPQATDLAILKKRFSLWKAQNIPPQAIFLLKNGHFMLILGNFWGIVLIIFALAQKTRGDHLHPSGSTMSLPPSGLGGPGPARFFPIFKMFNFALKDFLIQLHRNTTLSNPTVGGQFLLPALCPCRVGWGDSGQGSFWTWWGNFGQS